MHYLKKNIYLVYNHVQHSSLLNPHMYKEIQTFRHVTLKSFMSFINSLVVVFFMIYPHNYVFRMRLLKYYYFDIILEEYSKYLVP